MIVRVCSVGKDYSERLVVQARCSIRARCSIPMTCGNKKFVGFGTDTLNHVAVVILLSTGSELEVLKKRDSSCRRIFTSFPSQKWATRSPPKVNVVLGLIGPIGATKVKHFTFESASNIRHTGKLGLLLSRWQ